MFSYSRESSFRLYIGPVSDSSHNQDLRWLRLLYPRMSVYKEWQKSGPELEEDGRSTPHDGFISDLAFSKDGRKLLAGSSNGDAYLCDPNTHKFAAVIKASEDSTLRVLFVGDRNFVTAATDNSIKLWDVRNTQTSINTLNGHTNFVRSLDYDESSCKLISSSYDFNIRYWHVPSYQIKREENETDSDESTNYRGIFFKCPDITLTAISWHCSKMLCINSRGALYAINNLDLDHLKEDMKYARFDNTLPLLLSWITPNASTTRRNSLKIIDSSEYNVNPQYSVSKVHHLAVHPTLPVAMIRFSTSYKTLYSSKMKDWTSVYKLDSNLSVNDLSKFNTVKAFGSDILEENLLFASEETRYCTMFEKKPSFSKCGRVLASPEKNGVCLLGFSEKLKMPLTLDDTPSMLGPSMLGTAAGTWTHEPNKMHTIATIPRETDSVMCTRFSEVGLQLAVGETCGRISFHQPRI